MKHVWFLESLLPIMSYDQKYALTPMAEDNGTGSFFNFAVVDVH